MASGRFAPTRLALAGDVKRPNAFATEFRRRVLPQALALRVVDDPLRAISRDLQPHRDLLARPLAADAKRSIGQRNAADLVHASGPDARRQPPPDALFLPERRLLVGIVGATTGRQCGIRPPSALAGDGRVTFPLEGRGPVETRLQRLPARARGRLDPALTDAMRAFDDRVALTVAGAVPEQVDVQAKQPQRQIGRQITPAAPRRAIVEAQLVGPSPTSEPAAQHVLHRVPIDATPLP